VAGSSCRRPRRDRVPHCHYWRLDCRSAPTQCSAAPLVSAAAHWQHCRLGRPRSRRERLRIAGCCLALELGRRFGPMSRFARAAARATLRSCCRWKYSAPEKLREATSTPSRLATAGPRGFLK
jgi:hypothetical protein